MHVSLPVFFFMFLAEFSCGPDERACYKIDGNRTARTADRAMGSQKLTRTAIGVQ
jgi:hypothetical protein